MIADSRPSVTRASSTSAPLSSEVGLGGVPVTYGRLGSHLPICLVFLSPRDEASMCIANAWRPFVMKCPNCLRKNPSNAAKCYCGYSFQTQLVAAPAPQQPSWRFCPQCGMELHATTAFCPRCGHQIAKQAGSGKQQSPRPAIACVLDTLAWGVPNPTLICPHCQTVGQVHTKTVSQKKGISGGKAVGAILTGGLSLFLVGLPRKEKATEAHCMNCNSTWCY